MGMLNPKSQLGPRRLHPVDASLSSASPAPALDKRQSAFLLPGQLHASAEPCQIRTILGSCVSICLWDQRQRVGGMNHFLLPASREGEGGASMRFADVATEVLLEKLLRLGCQPRNLQAKIFGGSSMFQSQRYAVSLGARNVAAALDLLKDAGIAVSARETGGIQGRKIVFHTDDGMAWSRQI